VHWNAHPMFQVPLPTVKGVLVQLPCDCGVGPRRTCGVPVVVAVVPAVVEGAVSPEVAGAWVVVLDTGTVIADDPCSGGSAELRPVEVFGAG